MHQLSCHFGVNKAPAFNPHTCLLGRIVPPIFSQQIDDIIKKELFQALFPISLFPYFLIWFF